MGENDIDVGFLIKDAFKSIVGDPGYIVLFILPVLVYTIAMIHMWFLFGDTISALQNFQNIQNPEIISDTIRDKIFVILGLAILYVIIGLIVYTISVSGTIKKAAVQESGGKLDVVGALSFGIKEFPRLFAAVILGLTVLIGPIIGFFLLMILGMISNIIGLICFSLLLLVIVGLIWIYIGIRLSLYIYACVIDNLGPIQCLERSWQVSKGNFTLIFVTGLILVIIGIIVDIPFTIISRAGLPFVSIIGGIVTLPFLGPLFSITFVFLYLKITRKQITYAAYPSYQSPYNMNKPPNYPQ